METEEKWKFINSKIQGFNKYPNEWYIGLKKEGGEWKWVNEQILSINKWQPEWNSNIEPNGDGECVIMAKNFPPGTQGLFKDLNCKYALMFVCEYRKGNPRCKDGYYPPRCNETNLGNTSVEPTKKTIAAATQLTTTFKKKRKNQSNSYIHRDIVAYL
ncbi:aggrecan core protein-like [Actinia tenebrosa]|uniref:Aggrecan core protein-like n=1 Tax=Actinia tenebrosa TaxID=6105 RepID=A0A6P8HEV7_ACTTE|nr:aggrecan core protein-like [Actinia tenebrosa]